MISSNNASLSQIILRAGLPLIVTCCLVSLTFFIPLIDPTTPPYFDLSRPFAQLAYWLSFSGGTLGAPWIILLLVILLVTRIELSAFQKWKTASIIVIVVAVFVGGGAAINEHIIKPQLKLPRPNIEWLAGDKGSGLLEMTSQEFYALGDKAIRSTVLANVIVDKPKELSARVRAHWIEETGYSFPSGHAFTALFIATFFLLLVSSLLSSKRCRVFYALLPWALAVCYSRPILRVHTPLDITVGCLQGLVLGIIAWGVASWFIARFARKTV